MVVIGIALRGLGAISSLVVSVIVANKLGIHDSGIFFAVFAVASLLANISRFGLDNTILRIVSIDYHEGRIGNIRSILNKSLFLVLVFSIFISLLFFVVINFLPGPWSRQNYIYAYLNMIPGVMFWAASVIVSMNLAALGFTNWSIFFNNISTPFVFLLIISIFNGDGVEFWSYYSIACFITFLFSVVIIFRHIGRVPVVNSDFSIILKSCFPLWIVVIMGQITQWSGQLASSIYASPHELAVLAICQRISMVVSFVLLALDPIIGPRIAKLYYLGDYILLRQFVKKVFHMIFYLSVPLFLLLFIYAENVLSIFGQDFVEGSLILRILLIGQLVNVITGPVTMIIVMTGHEFVMRNIQIFSGCFAFLLAIILVLGGAFATAVAISLQNLLAFFYSRKLF